LKFSNLRSSLKKNVIRECYSMNSSAGNSVVIVTTHNGFCSVN
jgi:hypothetical protein